MQIAAIDAVSGVFRWFLVWDPTQPTATRPLAIRKDSTWYAYGWDITKNITEIFGKSGYLRTAYTYTPYGTATADGDVTQPLTWSSEYSDEELALIYYNYRHYNPSDGRWINRDPIGEQGGVNLYAFVENNALTFYDLLGYVKEFDRENEKVVMSCYKVSVFFQRGIRHTEKWKPGKKDIKRAKVGERIFSIIISVFPVYERKNLNGCPCKDIIKKYRKDLPFSIYLKAYVRTDKGEEPFYFYPSGLSEKTLIGKRHEQEATLGTILYGGGLYEVSGWQSIHLEPKRKKEPTSLRIVVGSPSINIYNKRHYFDYERKLMTNKKQKWWQKIFISLFILIIFPACEEQEEDKVQLKEMRRLYEEVCIPQRPGAFYPSYADFVPTDELETEYIRAIGDLWQYVREGIEVGALTVSPLRRSEYMHRADKYSIWWYEQGAKRDDIHCIRGLYFIYLQTLFDDIADDKKVYEYGAKLIKKWERDGYLREQPAGADLEQQLLLYISDLCIVRDCYEYGRGVDVDHQKAGELSKKNNRIGEKTFNLKEKEVGKGSYTTARDNRKFPRARKNH